jgi:hypothetical protein
LLCQTSEAARGRMDAVMGYAAAVRGARVGGHRPPTRAGWGRLAVIGRRMRYNTVRYTTRERPERAVSRLDADDAALDMGLV